MKAIFYILVIVMFAACAHKPPIEKIDENANVDNEILSLDGEINASAANQENVISPTNFKNAQLALREAKEAQGKGKKAKDVLSKVALGKAYIQKAHDVSSVGHKNIHEVIIVRGRAIEAGAPNYFTKEFEKADNRMMWLGKNLEENDVDDAVKRSSKVQEDYLNLELKAIKKNRLGAAKDLVDQGVKESGKKYAPNSYAQAQKKIKEAEDFITANRGADAEISIKTTEAQTAAELFLKIARDAQHNKKVSAEDLALELDQEKRIISKKDAELAESREMETKLANEKYALENLENNYKAAHEAFTEDEAEVYKQGDKLVIRLKGLNFAEAKSDLKGTSLPLLHKVEDVIRSFGESEVVVEGYTDSTGSKQINEKLSEERANVVKDFLVSTEAVSEYDISAVGMGDQKPVASNKTAMGKAQNRRVDVIITPAKKAEL